MAKAKAKKKLNGVHVQVAAEPIEAPQYLGHKPRTGKGNKIALARAIAAARNAARKSNLFDGIRGHGIVILIDAALQDAFLPKGKIEVRREGDRLQQALKLVRDSQRMQQAPPGLLT
jgi:hypothetical protein